MGRKAKYVNSHYKSLSDMDRKAREIKVIQGLCNTILANACYHEKEMESQIAVAEKRGRISDDEREVICNAWDYRCEIAKELIDDLKVFMEKTKGERKHGKKDV